MNQAVNKLTEKLKYLTLPNIIGGWKFSSNFSHNFLSDINVIFTDVNNNIYYSFPWCLKLNLRISNMYIKYQVVINHIRRLYIKKLK